MQRVIATHDTLTKMSLEPTLGLATSDQLVPSHLSTSVLARLVWLGGRVKYSPTAKHAALDTHEVPTSLFTPLAGLALWTSRGPSRFPPG